MSVYSYLKDLNMYPDGSESHLFAQVDILAKRATDCIHDYLRDLNLHPYES